MPDTSRVRFADTHLPCAGWGVPCPAGCCPCPSTTARTVLSEIGVTQSFFAPQCRHHPASVLHSESFMRRPAWLLPLFCSSFISAVAAESQARPATSYHRFCRKVTLASRKLARGRAPHALVLSSLAFHLLATAFSCSDTRSPMVLPVFLSVPLDATDSHVSQRP